MIDREKVKEEFRRDFKELERREIGILKGFAISICNKITEYLKKDKDNGIRK